MPPTRALFIRHALRLAAGAILGAGLAVPALAHHGWDWAEEASSDLTGVVTAVKLGNPHGEVTIDVSGVKWVVEVGQPWRNERAGLKDGTLAKGVTLTASGHKHRDPAKNVFKAERLTIEGRKYDLYPDRP